MYANAGLALEPETYRQMADLAAKCRPRFNEHGLATTDRALTGEVYREYLDRWAPAWRHCSLAILAPNGICHLHSDDPQARHRKVFVLQTNLDAWCFHDDDWQKLLLGDVYWVDATKPHAAVNFGTELRIHLAVDMKD